MSRCSQRYVVASQLWDCGAPVHGAQKSGWDLQKHMRRSQTQFWHSHPTSSKLSIRHLFYHLLDNLLPHTLPYRDCDMNERPKSPPSRENSTSALRHLQATSSKRQPWKAIVAVSTIPQAVTAWSRSPDNAFRDADNNIVTRLSDQIDKPDNLRLTGMVDLKSACCAE